MTRKRTDFRLLRERRARALERPELRLSPPAAKPTPEDVIAAAIAAGKLTKLPPARRRN
jgi:hypothetical protein